MRNGIWSMVHTQVCASAEQLPEPRGCSSGSECFRRSLATHQIEVSPKDANEITVTCSNDSRVLHQAQTKRTSSVCWITTMYCCGVNEKSTLTDFLCERMRFHLDSMGSPRIEIFLSSLRFISAYKNPTATRLLTEAKIVSLVDHNMLESQLRLHLRLAKEIAPV